MPFNPTLPTWTNVNQADSASSSGQTDLRTGLALQGGNLVLGDYFDLTESEANDLSYTTTGTLHAGRYRWVQVDSAATAANVKTGTIGLLASLAQGVNVVTSYDKGLGTAVGNLRPVVFLNAITPGYYGFVQELGQASVLAAAGVNAPAGTSVISTTGGEVTNGTTAGRVIGTSLETATAGSVFQVLLSLPVVQD